MKSKYDEPLSNFAFKFNVRRYTTDKSKATDTDTDTATDTATDTDTSKATADAKDTDTDTDKDRSKEVYYNGTISGTIPGIIEGLDVSARSCGIHFHLNPFVRYPLTHRLHPQTH